MTTIQRVIMDDDGICPGEDCEHSDPHMPHRHEARHLYNAAVKISHRDGATKLLVNDQDLSMAILAEGFSVTFEDGEAHVTMTLATNDYDIDLPDAEVEVQ